MKQQRCVGVVYVLLVSKEKKQNAIEAVIQKRQLKTTAKDDGNKVLRQQTTTETRCYNRARAKHNQIESNEENERPR